LVGLPLVGTPRDNRNVVEARPDAITASVVGSHATTSGVAPGEKAASLRLVLRAWQRQLQLHDGPIQQQAALFHREAGLEDRVPISAIGPIRLLLECLARRRDQGQLDVARFFQQQLY
jgi:hypothetical protein